MQEKRDKPTTVHVQTWMENMTAKLQHSSENHNRLLCQDSCSNRRKVWHNDCGELVKHDSCAMYMYVYLLYMYVYSAHVAYGNCMKPGRKCNWTMSIVECDIFELSVIVKYMYIVWSSVTEVKITTKYAHTYMYGLVIGDRLRKVY